MHLSKIIYLLILLLLFSCSSKDLVEITKFTPTGEVERTANFTIEFNKELAPPDKIGEWLTDEFIVFKPQIKGKFKWIDSKTLQFSPDFALESMQEYSADISEKVLFDRNLSADFETVIFNTPHFDATKAEFFWNRIPHKNHIASIQVNLYFNYPVETSSLAENISIELDGKKRDFNFITSNESTLISLNLGEIKQTDEEQVIKVVISKGLESILGKEGMTEDREFEYELAKVTNLDINNVNAGYDGKQGFIDIYLNQPIVSENIKNFIELDPSNDMDVKVYENHIKLLLNNKSVTQYNLKVKKGIKGIYGGELDREFEKNVSLYNLEPAIYFTDKEGKYLMLEGSKKLSVNVVNVDTVSVEVSQISKNNILYYKNRYNYYYDYSYSPHYSPDSYGKALYKEKIGSKSSGNWLNTVNLDLSKAYEDKFKGVILLDVRSDEKRWIKDTKIFSVSDLGIIAKKSGDELIIFINSISNAEPVQNAEVEVYSTHNQPMLKEVTNSFGVVKFDLKITNKRKDYPRIIFVEYGGDFNYLDLRESNIETSRFNVGGTNDYHKDYKVFIYGDRNLYRPGETVNLSAIVRDSKTNVVKDQPVVLKIISPTGKIFEEFPHTLNSQGSFEQSFNMPDYVQTGTYNAELYNGAKKIIGHYSFSVEEFVPDKIRVNLKAEKDKLVPGEKVKIMVESEYLFGGKASNLKYEGEIQFRQTAFKSEKYKGYNFAEYVGDKSTIETYKFNGKLDEDGHAEIIYEVPKNLKSGGKISAFAYVSVFDLTGRTVNRISEFDIFTKDYFLGIMRNEYYIKRQSANEFKLAAVDQNDNPLKKFKAVAKLIRYKWDSILRRDVNGRNRYTSVKTEIIEWEKEIEISGTNSLKIIPPTYGQYELRLSKKDEKVYYKTNFYAYGWGSRSASSFDVEKEGKIEIVLDKEKYEPGEKLTALFKCPFSGKLLVTLERNGVYDYKYVEVKDNSAQTEFVLNENYMPNVFISATLFKPYMQDSESPFLVGHGYSPVKIEKKTNILPVTIIASNKVKPKTTQEIIVKTIPNKDIYVTFAAVDEGILQIKNYETPDAYKHMYARRPLKVSSYDIYPLLIPDVINESSSTGGDELARQLKKRVNPVKSKRYKLLSYWSGIKKTNIKGEVKIELPIPQFNGEVRLMALVYEGSKFGYGEKSVKVSDDLILEPEMPRFLSVNDKLVSNVALINTTDKAVKVTISASASGAVKLTSNEELNINIAPNSTQSAVFAFESGNTIGEGKIIYRTAGLAKVEAEIQIGVRPISPLYFESGFGDIKAGDDIKVKFPDHYIKSTQTNSLVISKLPIVRFTKHLKYLLRYPYGCIEQTVSSVFPQLYFGEMATTLDPDYYMFNNSVYYVNQGIKKLEAMQLYDGSMAYWSGRSYSNWWSTVYAAHFLVEAKKAGYYVNQNVINKLTSYLSKRVKEKKTYDYVKYSKNKKTIIKIAQKEIIYSLYVLALIGKADQATMNYYKSMPQLLTNDTRYLLAGAFALMGNRTAFSEIIPEFFEEETTDRLSGGSFDSSIRANAIMLNVLVEVDPANSQIPIIAKYLSQQAELMYSTQERSFTYLALGKAFKNASQSDVKVEVFSDDALLDTYMNKTLTIEGHRLKNDEITLKSEGKGNTYYFWSSEGISKSKTIKEEDSNIKVRRTYYDYKTKNIINTNNIPQGTLIVCKISLTCGIRSVKNVAVTDMIPAGFEIENPRLSTSTNFNWQNKNKMRVDYMDVRDDRLILFTDLTAKKSYNFYYMMRAVNKGEFQLPVIGAEAMYDGEFHSYNGAGKIIVR